MDHHRLSRRLLLGGVCAASLGAWVRPDQTHDAASGLTPDEALERLVQGNRAFSTDSPLQVVQGRERRLALAQSQTPFAVLVSCSDSRVPPELLFGRGLGELFIVRNAGNTVDTTALGSIEYAVNHLNTPLVVVMGHERCGAVAAAVKTVEENAHFPGAIGSMIEPIIPAVLAARAHDHGDRLDNSVRHNVRRVVEHLRETASPDLLARQAAGRLKIVGARYDLDTGVVDFFDTGAV